MMVFSFVKFSQPVCILCSEVIEALPSDPEAVFQKSSFVVFSFRVSLLECYVPFSFKRENFFQLEKTI